MQTSGARRTADRVGGGRTFASRRANGSTKPFSRARNWKVRHSYLVLCPRPRGMSRRVERSARGRRRPIGDSLTEAQEVWALRKTGYFKIGERR
jgi:hypothetical protein